MFVFFLFIQFFFNLKNIKIALLIIAFCFFFQIQNRNWQRLRKVVGMFFRWCMRNLNGGLSPSSHMPASVEYELSLLLSMASSKMRRNLYYFLNDLCIVTGIYKWLYLSVWNLGLEVDFFFLFPGNQSNKRGWVGDLRWKMTFNTFSSLVLMPLGKF